MAEEPQRLGDLYRVARAALAQAGIESAALDARLLLEEAAGCSHAELLAHPEKPVEAQAVARFASWILRRSEGEPVFRILGWREFRGMKLRLSPGVLEPRPDTETLVEHALFPVRAWAEKNGRVRILDLGCGSGAIALALLAEEARAEALGVDISDDALATARRNATEHRLESRFTALRSHWFEAVQGEFDFIVSNPPYVATSEIDSLSREVRLHDPLAALDGGGDGLDAYREISSQALEFLAADGHVFLEIGAGQAEAVKALFAQRQFQFVSERRDLHGIIRSLAFRPC